MVPFGDILKKTKRNDESRSVTARGRGPKGMTAKG